MGKSVWQYGISILRWIQLLLKKLNIIWYISENWRKNAKNAYLVDFSTFDKSSSKNSNYGKFCLFSDKELSYHTRNTRIHYNEWATLGRATQVVIHSLFVLWPSALGKWESTSDNWNLRNLRYKKNIVTCYWHYDIRICTSNYASRTVETTFLAQFWNLFTF